MNLTATIPRELQEKKQWVCWRYQLRRGKQTKIPIDPKRNYYASSTNRHTWTNFIAANYAIQNNKRWLDGIGFVFSTQDVYYGIDLDDCVSEGRLNDLALDIVDQFNTYTEVSPSGTGIKLFCKVNTVEQLPPTFVRTNNWPIEIYPHSRFFTCTGLHIEYTPKTVNSYPLLEDWISKLITYNPDGSVVTKPEIMQQEPLSDTAIDIVIAILNSKVAFKYLRFVDGDWGGYPSQSEADMALMGLLAFFTNNNIQLMLDIAWNTGLARPKWNRIINKTGLPYIQHLAHLVIK